MSKAQNLPQGSIKDELIAPRPQYKEANFRSLIQQCGLKITSQRLSILKALSVGVKTHLTAREVFDRVQKSHSDIGFATVYRFLKTMTSKGVTSELKMSQAPSRYELKSQTHHHHITCLGCGKIVEFKNDKMEKMITDITQSHRFDLKHHIIELYGICNRPSCALAQKN